MKQPRTARRESTAAILNEALRHHHRGDLAAAETGYRRLLNAAEPAIAGSAHHMLGVAALQNRRAADALRWIERALELQPDHPDYLLNQGLAYKQLARTDEARASFARAVAQRPDGAAGHYHLGNLLLAFGEPEQAEIHLRRATELQHDNPELYNALGNALKALQRPEDAATAYRRALEIYPEHAASHNNLANLLHRQGRLQQALEHYRRALKAAPKAVAIENNLANLLMDQGDYDQAVAAYKRVLRRHPDAAQTHYNLGNALRLRGQPELAIAAYRKALQLQPDTPPLLNNLGVAQIAAGELAAAAASFRQALRHDPDYAEALDNLIDVLLRQCDWRELDERMTKLLAPLGEPDTPEGPPPAHLPRPFLLARLPVEVDGRLRLRAARAATRAACAGVTAAPAAEAVPAESPRLRIGYISTDFKFHATAHLIHGLFGRHDRERFEVYGYALGGADDSDYRRRIERGCDVFRELSPFDLDTAAARIAADRIAVLIDLNGHSAANRIALFARRPAPVQITYLGFPGTSGADFFDYVVVDDIVVPAARQPEYDECLLSLPHSYQVNSERPAVSGARADAEERAAHGLPAEGVVFCCFNAHYKIEPLIFERWAAILYDTPGSVLWLLDGPEELRDNLRREAETRGLDPRRLVFAPKQDPAAHLDRHRCADLFLDTCFYNAHTTASDALWAGLPVLSCKGDSFPSRVGHSVLHAVGLDELAVDDLDAYQRLAVELARDPARLAALRQGLLAARDSCPLFDTEAFTRDLERGLEAVWARHRSGQPPQPLHLGRGRENPARDF